jgi:hypothetical protein
MASTLTEMQQLSEKILDCDTMPEISEVIENWNDTT